MLFRSHQRRVNGSCMAYSCKLVGRSYGNIDALRPIADHCSLACRRLYEASGLSKWTDLMEREVDVGYTSQGGYYRPLDASRLSTWIGWRVMDANLNEQLHAAIQRLPSCSTTKIASHGRNSEMLEVGYSFVTSRPRPCQIGSVVCRSISMHFSRVHRWSLPQ